MNKPNPYTMTVTIPVKYDLTFFYDLEEPAEYDNAVQTAPKMEEAVHSFELVPTDTDLILMEKYKEYLEAEALEYVHWLMEEED